MLDLSRNPPLARLAGIVALGALATPAVVQAQPSARVNQYRPAETPLDGFQLRSPATPHHLSVAARLHLDYANDPLVFENTAGATDSELTALVSDQLTAHLAVALGLYDAAMLFIVLPVDLVMEGEALGDEPTATGFGVGDFAFGARLNVHEGPHSGAAIQLTSTAPSGAGGDGVPGVAGDSGVTVAIEALGSLDAGPLFVLLNAGARWRKDVRFAASRFTDVLVFGASVGWPLLDRALVPRIELVGESPLDDIGNRVGSPLAATAGATYQLDPRVRVGLAGGAGVLRGYGSPDLRVVGSVAFMTEGAPLKSAAEQRGMAEAEEDTVEAQQMRGPDQGPGRGAAPDAPVVIADYDGDGVADLDDRCPKMPGKRDGCAEFVTYDEELGTLVLQRPLRFAPDSAEANERNAEVLAEIAAFLRRNAGVRFRVDSHMMGRSRPQRAARLATSVERSRLVIAELVALGVAPGQLEGAGCGTLHPVTPQGGAHRAKNDRIEFHQLAPVPAASVHSALGCMRAPTPEPVPKPQPAPQPAPAPKPAPVPAPKPEAKPAPAPTPGPAPAAKPSAPPTLPAPRATAPAPTPAAPPPAKAPAASPKPVAAGTAGAGKLGVTATTTTAALLAALAADPSGDRDGDGVANAKDTCPVAPGPRKAQGCPDDHGVDLEQGMIVLDKGVRFDDGNADLQKRSARHLDEVARTLAANPDMKVLIEAHVAEEEDAAASLELTRARAARVREHLVRAGVDPTHLFAYGCGQERPVAPNNVPWGRKKNERVDLRLLDPAPASGIPSMKGCSPSE